MRFDVCWGVAHRFAQVGDGVHAPAVGAQQHAEAVVRLREGRRETQRFGELLRRAAHVPVEKQRRAELVVQRRFTRREFDAFSEVRSGRFPVAIVQRFRPADLVRGPAFERCLELPHQRIWRTNLARTPLPHMCVGSVKLTEAAIRHRE